MADKTPAEIKAFAVKHAPQLAAGMTELCGKVIEKGLRGIIEEAVERQMRSDKLEAALRSALMTMSLSASHLEKDGDEHGVAWNLRNAIAQAKAVLGIVAETEHLELKKG